MNEHAELRSHRDTVNKQFEEEFSSTLKAIEYRNRLTKGILLILCLCGLFLLIKLIFLRSHAFIKENWRDKYNNVFKIVAIHRIDGSGVSGCLEVQNERRRLWVSKDLRSEAVFDSYSLHKQFNLSSKESAQLPAARVLGCDLVEESKDQQFLYVLDGNAKQLVTYQLADSLTFKETTSIRGLNSPAGVSRVGSTRGHLHLSDGRNRLYSMDVSSGQVEDSYLQINGRDGESEDIGIGALQQVGDFLVAVNTNVQNELLLLDTTSARLAGQIDLNQLFDYMNEVLQAEGVAAIERGRPVSAVAFDATHKTLLVGGNGWPFLFELKFPERTFTRKPVDSRKP